MEGGGSEIGSLQVLEVRHPLLQCRQGGLPLAAVGAHLSWVLPF